MELKKHVRFSITRRFTLRLWVSLCAAVLLAILFPISLGIVRRFLLIAIPLVWVGALYLSSKRRWLFAAVAVIGIGTVCLLTFPGRAINPSQLQTLYVQHLKSYEGTLYIFGGENRLGIDCSGLVRRSLADASLHLGLITLNPNAVRQALDLWLHDSSAQALGNHYRSLTTPVTSAESINYIDYGQVQPGDLAVTQNGLHVLAYLGEKIWIQADPDVMRVIVNAIPSTNKWFSVPVNIVRWSVLSIY